MDAALPLYVHVHFWATCRKQQNECCLIFLMQWLQKGIFFELICTWSENSRISSYDIYHSYKCFELPSSKFSTAVGCHRKEVEISYQYAIRLKTLLNGLLYLLYYWVTMTSILCPPVQDSCHGYDSYVHGTIVPCCISNKLEVFKSRRLPSARNGIETYGDI